MSRPAKSGGQGGEGGQETTQQAQPLKPQPLGFGMDAEVPEEVGQQDKEDQVPDAKKSPDVQDAEKTEMKAEVNETRPRKVKSKAFQEDAANPNKEPWTRLTRTDGTGSSGKDAQACGLWSHIKAAHAG